MRFGRAKVEQPADAFDTQALRRAADRIIGWKWVGDGPLDPRALLRSASYEIDRLQKLVKEGAAV